MLVASLRAEVASLRAQMTERDEEIVWLRAALEDARRAGKRQAAPFRRGEPQANPKRPGRKGGDAHGRHAHRAVPEEADRTVDAGLPLCCPRCGGDVDHQRWEDQYQTEVAAATPTVTRFRVAVGRCGSCGHRVQGRHPEQTSDALGAACSQLGPRAKALAAWLHYGLGLSFGRCAQVLAQFGITVTRGALSSGAQTTSTALVPTQTAICRRVSDAAAVTMDETGWRVNGRGAWLWVATTADTVAYDVAGGRGFTQATNLVPDTYDGILIRDGWVAYKGYEAARHQSCLAHLIRRADTMAQDLPAAHRAVPLRVAAILRQALGLRDLHPDERFDPAAELAQQLDDLCALTHRHDEVRRLAGHLQRERDHLFTFLFHPHVEATNWRAEHAVRPAVVNRKTYGGNRSWTGAVTQGRIMSLLGTARLQGANAIDLLAGLARAPTPHIINGLNLT